MRFTERARAAYDQGLQRLGDALFRGDRVHLEGADGHGWEATVRNTGDAGEQEYDVLLRPERGGVVRGRCGCGADGRPCAHQWAVLRELEALAQARRRLGAEAECFRRDPITARVIGWRDAAARAAALAPPPTDDGEAPASDLDSPWARRIDRLTRSRDRSSARAEAERATWLLDLRQSRDRDVLALLPVRFDASGRPPALLGRDPQDFHPADRRLLACLRGAGDATWLETEGAPQRPFCVPADLIPTVLPLVRAAGLYLWDNREDTALPRELPAALRWDLDDAYRFAAVHRNGDGTASVRGELWRAGAVVPSDGVLALLGADFAVVRTDPHPEPSIVAIDAGPGAVLARALLVDGELTAPAAQSGPLLAKLTEIPGADRLESDELEWLAVEPTPALHLIEPEREDERPLLAGELRFCYGATQVAADAPRTCVAIHAGCYARRRPHAEAEWKRRFAAAGGLFLDSGVPAVPRERSSQVLQELLDAGWQVRIGSASVLAAGAPHLQARAPRERVDWFRLDGGVPFGEHVLPLPELLVARPEPGVVALDANTLGLVPTPLAKKLRAVARCAPPGAAPLEFRGDQSWILDALLATRDGASIEFDDHLAGVRERMASGGAPRPRREPPGFGATLRNYQREGLGWLRFVADLGLGACLADDMGLGKTVQVLARLEQRRQDRDGPAAPSLVVAPRSLMGNWQREAARFAPHLRVAVFTGPRRWAALGTAGTAGLLSYDVVLATYGTVRQDAARLREVEWDYVILDEAQAIKNARSQASKAVRLLDARHRLALSGTPVENHLGELWALFEFLNPGMLGRNDSFQELVREATEDGDEASLADLRRALRPLMLRRTKENVLRELPPKSEQVLYCPMGPTQQRLYDELAAYYRDALLRPAAERDEPSQIQVLEGLLRLRQAACHPGLLDPNRGAQDCAKFEVLRPMLDEILAGGHKALVFSQFKSFLGLLAEQLRGDGVRFAYLDGATTDREGCVDEFQNDPDCGVFLISLRAGGAGLNLTAADYVFLLDPWWNPAAEAQAVDRAHRMGQQRPVMAYRLLCPGTVEEHVAQLQQRKRDLAESVLGTGSTPLRDLERADLELLLGGAGGLGP